MNSLMLDVKVNVLGKRIMSLHLDSTRVVNAKLQDRILLVKWRQTILRVELRGITNGHRLLRSRRTDLGPDEEAPLHHSEVLNSVLRQLMCHYVISNYRCVQLVACPPSP